MSDFGKVFGLLRKLNHPNRRCCVGGDAFLGIKICQIVIAKGQVKSVN